MSRSNGSSYAPIADYGFIADCHSAALVSSRGSIDWWCVPRVDAGSVFGRLLDRERGGYCSIEPLDAGSSIFREYVPDTLVLTTTFRVHGGEAQVWDSFLMPPDGHRSDDRRLLRVVEGRRGVVRIGVRVAPRFDYGDVKPWIRRHGTDLLSATGGDDALLVWSDSHLEPDDDLMHLEGEIVVRPGDRVRLLLTYRRPEQLEDSDLEAPEPARIDRALDETIEWWRRWSARLTASGPDAASVRRSALVLKALAYPPTGAIAAAATTSLPEAPGAGRNWDYRYSWIRDSVLASRSLAHLGLGSEADAFRRFVERSTAGAADQLRVLYGIGGERRVPELDLGHLEGYRGARPVRVGNDAATQLQLDTYGQLVVQSWNWHRRGNSPDDDYWRFLVGLVDAAVARWREPDSGIWEWRTGRRHFVHSKVLCWAATDLGLRLAEQCMRKAPERRWRKARDEIRAAVEAEGYDDDRGVFVQAFGERSLDAALLRLPVYGFVDWRDDRMVRTVDAIIEELDDDGLLRRYATDDGLAGRESAFLCCSFWLVEALARQERHEEARRYFDRVLATANGLGLFAEQYDAPAGEMRGNFPQALTHLAHIEAALALGEHADAALGD